MQAPAPSRPIDRGLAGPGLLAHLLVSKYADHQPLYRQSEIYARDGVDLDRSTLAGWVGASCELLQPLIDRVRDHVLAATKLHADDTPVPVFAPSSGKTKRGRLWTYVSDDRPTPPAVWCVVRLLTRSQRRAAQAASARLSRRSRPTPTPASIIHPNDLTVVFIDDSRSTATKEEAKASPDRSL